MVVGVADDINGIDDGSVLGPCVGRALGVIVVGSVDGSCVGTTLGVKDILAVGLAVAITAGTGKDGGGIDGTGLGAVLGATDGASEGWGVGKVEGA